MLNNVKHAVERGVKLVGSDVVGVSGKVLKPRPIGDYLGYQIPKPNGGFTNVYAHKLICYLATGDDRAFISGFEVHHKNSNRHDNRPDNLEIMVAHDHESLSSRLNTHNSKINLEIGREIKNRYNAGGISQRALAQEYGLSQQHVSDIVNGNKWGSKWD